MKWIQYDVKKLLSGYSVFPLNIHQKVVRLGVTGSKLHVAIYSEMVFFVLICVGGVLVQQEMACLSFFQTKAGFTWNIKIHERIS